MENAAAKIGRGSGVETNHDKKPPALKSLFFQHGRYCTPNACDDKQANACK